MTEQILLAERSIAKMADEIESLRQQLEDSSHAYDVCAQEHSRMSQQIADANETLKDHGEMQAALCRQLAESQAREKMLRDALEGIKWLRKPGGAPNKYQYEVEINATKALSIPSDSTALEEYLKTNGWRQCAKGQRTTQYCGLTEEAVRQAKREALLNAAKICDALCDDDNKYGHNECDGGAEAARSIRNMAKELK